jgi:phenylpropionate dioxygenase-like ring-hydroxylating dioxygenase large terminal subunit
MIQNQWYVVMSSSQVGRKPLGATRMGEKLVFYRDATGKAICLADKCAHRGASLSLGKTSGQDRVMCPFHGLEYDPAGKCRSIPANGREATVPSNFFVRSYPTYEDHGFIWIWWGPSNPSPETPEFFDDIPATALYATVIDHWNAHYSRVIENQLDCVHLPFVHYNTIGRGNKTLVNGPGIEWVTDNKFFMYVYNEIDSGQKPQKNNEVPIPSPSGYKIEFQFPNLWENRIADKVRVLAAFVPVDAENTLLYLRFYQAFAKIPILGGLIAKAAMPFNVYVAHQDRRIVNTQIPKISGLVIGENLFQGDFPIIEYRKRRQKLQDLLIQ